MWNFNRGYRVMKSADEIKNELKGWLEKKSPLCENLTFETNIIEAGLISSLEIMELILFIEQLKGEKFNLKKIKPGSFNSIDSIYKSFF